MVKSVVVTLTGDIPDSELNKDCKIVVGTIEYAGKVTAIVVHIAPSTTPPSTQVTIEGAGLKVV